MASMKNKFRMKIAIIGTGISGLGVAASLHTHHDITIYEKNPYIGGHSRTVEVMCPEGPVPVDTGFIVFNYRNYPLLTRLFEFLNVPVAKSDMSFGASIQNGWLEYGTPHPLNVFAQKGNILRPAFWGMILNILKFNKLARNYLDKDPSITLGQCLDELQMGRWFREYFLLPMGGAIWSTPLDLMLEFPAHSFIRFFDNHGLLTLNDQPQWYTVPGGSKEYVAKLTRPFKQHIKTGCGVNRVLRTSGGVVIYDVQGNAEDFDQVVFACHADQALAMIEEASAEEIRILSNFRYQKNKMVLHSDTSFMPKNKAAWASWVYLSAMQKDNNHAVSLSYWMNRLQPLATKMPVIVTLNPGHQPQSEMVHDEYIFEHPLFDKSAIGAQHEIEKIQGTNRFWFCGAYQRYGFHEDGLASAVNILRQMGIVPEWI